MYEVEGMHTSPASYTLATQLCCDCPAAADYMCTAMVAVEIAKVPITLEYPDVALCMLKQVLLWAGHAMWTTLRHDDQYMHMHARKAQLWYRPGLGRRGPGLCCAPGTSGSCGMWMTLHSAVRYARGVLARTSAVGACWSRYVASCACRAR